MPNHVTNRVHLIGEPERIRELLEAVRFDDGEIGTLDFNKLIPMPEALNLECGSLTANAMSAYLSAVNPDNPAFASTCKLPRLLFQNLMRKISKEHYGCYAKTMRTPKDIGEKADEMIALGKKYVENFQRYGATTWYDFRVANWGSKWNSYNPQPFTEDTLIFQTAWSRVLPVIAALAAKYPDIAIEYAWADEDIGCNVGYAEFQDGELVNEIWCDPDTKEAYEFAAAVLGEELSDWGLVFNEKSQNYEYIEEAEEENPVMK